MTGICSGCRDHAEFNKEDEWGGEVAPDDPRYKDLDSEALSGCCGEPEVTI